jgi:ubiquitin carboxyl-terminal hydrolase L5
MIKGIWLIDIYRRMDMLNADLALSNDFDKWQKSKKNLKKKNTNKVPKKRKKDDDEAAFHFIAYVPIHRSVWRLDGLQRQPVNLGKFVTDLNFQS